MRTFKCTTILFCVLQWSGVGLFAQNIGINVTGVAPDPSALLDVSGATLPVGSQRGILIPRVALTATNVALPVTAPAISLLLFNTATSPTGPFSVTPGFYFWDGSLWRRLNDGTSHEWLSYTNNGF